jgi:DNA-binding NtrC family response regulator
VVLLVEDSLIIAMDAEDILTRLGASRVVTAASLAQARDEISRETFEAAVLDVNLGAETSLPLADELAAAGVPFLFATGYGEQLKLPAEHATALVTQKPYTLASIARAVSDLLSK